jgi:mono/diheme cytochrome c family protein
MGLGHVPVLALAAMAAAAQAPQRAGPPLPTGPTRAQTGHALAQRMCAICHQVEAAGASPNDAAPPFRVLAARYDEVTLGKKLDDIATGHYRMPPTHVTNDEIDSLVDYLESLRGDGSARREP